MSKPKVATAAQWSEFINELIAVEVKAFRLGMGETGHALNDAKKKAGYEREYQLTKVRR